MLESESSALTAWRYPYGKSGEPLFNGVNSGTRTHDLQGHNLALYQLSYIHHKSANSIIVWCARATNKPSADSPVLRETPPLVRSVRRASLSRLGTKNSPLGTFSRRARSSPQLYTGNNGAEITSFVPTGAPRGTRTPNLHLRRVLLYPVELWVHYRSFYPYKTHKAP